MAKPTESKTCSTCKLLLPLNDFSKNKTTKGGLQNQCKRCKKEYKKQWNLKNVVCLMEKPNA